MSLYSSLAQGSCYSTLAQGKRAGPITQRSLDRNQLMRVWNFTSLFVRDSIVASIPACHPRQFAGDPGSIPGRGVFIACEGRTWALSSPPGSTPGSRRVRPY